MNKHPFIEWPRRRRWAAACAGLVLLLAGVNARGLTAEEQARFADGIYLRGYYETAVSEYLLFLRDHLGHERTPDVLYRTGECYRQMNNQAGAERFYKRVADEYPDTLQAARAMLRRAEAALADERTDDARALLKALLKTKPGGEIAAAGLHYLGLTEQKAGDSEAAAKAFGEILKKHGDTPQATFAALELAKLGEAEKVEADKMTGWFEAAVKAAATPGARAEAMYRWGEWAYQRGQYQLAADVLQSLQMELPEERRANDALLIAAWSFYYLGRSAEALDDAEKLIANAQDAETAASGRYLRANCLRRMNRDGEALQDYEYVAGNHPGTTFAGRAAYEIMVTHFKRGDYAKALSAMPGQPDKSQAADVLWMRAESERELGRLELARARYETLLTDFPKSAQAPAALMRLGAMARAAGQHAEAADRFRRVADDYPRYEGVADALKEAALARQSGGDAAQALEDWNALLVKKIPAEAAAEARLHKALVLIDLNRGAEAAALLDELLAAKPPAGLAAQAHYWRGTLLAGAEKWSEAEKAFRACLESGPDASTASLARLSLTQALQRQGRMDEAADQVEALAGDARQVADNPALMEWLIRHRFDQEDTPRALKAAEALAAHAAEPSWRQMAWYRAGICRTELGHEQQAIAAFEKAVAQDARTREGAEARLLLAMLELKTGSLARAEEYFAAAAESATDDDALNLRVRAYFGLGETAEAAGDRDKAARHFMSVAVLYDDPEWTPRALFRAGQLYEKSGNAAAQKSAWDELLERYPESSFARQVEAMSP